MDAHRGDWKDTYKLSAMVNPGEGVGQVRGVFMKEDFPVVLSTPEWCLNIKCLSLSGREAGSDAVRKGQPREQEV